ncbi:molecular chaperone [Nostoc sp. UCD121]|uniref:fimbrial biogenesis chaperone n=1 Tax=unclassified Nostoc TaxID=2593658 RepID=UPI0016280235|nr:MULTISPECIES: fimbria/pilus periplasmic chaperone [unclassified Nostoc]MBC1221482.1 molecular chaperone [Nostoc sp. UCD120]MBC1277493.1 molecular chaperone [Nostoc sp. UCD121]MBC1294795.1 molecular chaperone [Nostoc sp. UCD122]
MFHKPQNIALALIGTIALGMPPATALNVGVSPPRMELEMNSKQRVQSIRVVNRSSETVEMKASVKSWTMNENNKLEEIMPSEQSLSQWIVFTPSRFTIAPGGTQTIRFTIRPKTQPKVGEHRAVLFLEEVASNQPKASNTVATVGRVGVVIYGYTGAVKRVGVLNSLTVDTKPNAMKAVFDISSQGNGYVRLNGQYAIWPAAKYPGAEVTKPIANLGKPQAKEIANLVDVGLLPTAPILPDTRRRVLLPITKKLLPGNYVLDINGELNGVAIQKGIPFTVDAPVANNSRTQPQPTSQNLRDSLKNPQRRR